MADERAVGALALIEEQVADLLKQVAEKKRLANEFAKLAGLDAVYLDIEDPGDAAFGSLKIRVDEFVNH